MRDKRNYLDFVPVKNPQLPGRRMKGNRHGRGHSPWHRRQSGTGRFQPSEVSHIRMDVFGSFIWKEIDGEQNIYEIGQKVKEYFGKEAEPLYERLTTFFRILAENKYITYKNN